jgi:hypothetical protein
VKDYRPGNGVLRHPREGGDPEFAERMFWISQDPRLRRDDAFPVFGIPSLHLITLPRS